MNYNFKTKSGSIIRVFYNSLPVGGDHGVVSWWEQHKSGHKEYRCTVKEDNNSKLYFTYHGEKIYMQDYLAYTPEEFVQLITEDKSRLYSEDLCHTLMKYGIGSLRVIQRVKPMTRVNFGGISIGFESYSNLDDKSTWDSVEYSFTETDIFKLSDNYKVKLVPTDEDKIGTYASHDYYISDLVSLISGCKEEYKLKTA